MFGLRIDLWTGGGGGVGGVYGFCSLGLGCGVRWVVDFVGDFM